MTSLKVCDWSGHIFGASASPRSLTKKLAMSPSSTVHGGQHDTKYVAFELLMHAAFMADEIWGFLLEHQLVCMSRGESIFIVSGTYLAHTTLSRNSRIVCALVCNKDILYNPAQSGYVQMSRKKSTQPPPAWLGSAGRPRVKQTLQDACDAPPLPTNTQMHANGARTAEGYSQCTPATWAL